MDPFLAPVNRSEADSDSSTQWLTISDLMSGLAMLFALLFIVAQISLLEKTKKLKAYEEAMRDLPLAILAAIEQEFGSGQARVDTKTGEVLIDNALLFEEGSAKLSGPGQAFLKRFFPVYSKVLFSRPEYTDLVRYVVLDGRTSSKGSADANRSLSLNRSLSVANYIFSDSVKLSGKEKLTSRILMAGRGEVDADQSVDSARDRKVVLRFEARRPDLDGLFGLSHPPVKPNE